MKKLLTLLSLVLGLQISLFGSSQVYANAKEEKPILAEESYPEIGYQTIEESVIAFEEHFNQDLKLRLRTPPIAFTHHFGRFSDLEGETNDSFEIEMINENQPENLYKIDIRPVKHKINVDKYVLDTFTLKNGIIAKYMAYRPFVALVFERDGWQYMLSINKRVSDVVTPKVLVEIANSIDYPPARKD